MNNVDLLDPRASDRFLRAYALLAAEYSRGARSAVDSLLPFCFKAVEQFSGQQFEALKVRDFIAATYRVKIPLYMMDGLKNRLHKEGMLSPVDVEPRLFVCTPKQDFQFVDEQGLDLSTEDIRGFEESLEKFAAERGVAKPVASESWSEALIEFFSGNSEFTRQVGKLGKQIINSPNRIDDWVVSEFLSDLRERSPSGYSVAKKLFYGVLVADFFSCFQDVSASGSLSKVDVVLDTPLLMRLLGTSGELLKTATLELIEDVGSLGGSVFYFHHTFAEMIEGLEAIIAAIDNNGEPNRETQKALLEKEVTKADVRMLPKEADIRLGKLGITQHSVAYEHTSSDLQIDETAFAKLIGGNRYSQHPIRFDRDAQSLALIVRLRDGTRPRSLPLSRAVFVTHNGKFARCALSFTGGDADFEVPPILTTDQVSVLAWLTKGGAISDEKLNARLAAACYQARLPKDGWETEFWSRLEQLRDSSEECRTLLQSQLVQNALRESVLDRSFGDPSLAKGLDLVEVLSQIREGAQSERDQVHKRGVSRGREEAAREFDEKMQRSAEKWGTWLSFLVVIGTLLLVTALYIVPAVSVLFDPDGRGWLYYSNGVIALVLGLLGLVALFDFSPSVKRYRVKLAKWFESLVLRFLQWTLH